MDQAVCCYRHPDRETGIRCTRCERPICPACMVSASVGFQCPECVAQADHRHTQAPRTVAGGRASAGDPFLITKLLIAVNIAVFVLELIMGDRLVRDLGLYAVCAPPRFGHICGGAADGQWYRVLTSAFLHTGRTTRTSASTCCRCGGSAPRWSSGSAAPATARSISSPPSAASAAVLLITPDTLTLGASGAIFGLFGATAVYVRRLRYDMRPILILLGLNILFSFTWANMSWQAHIGGLIAGTVVAIGMLYAPRERRDLVQWGTAAAVLAVSLILIVVAVAQVTP